MQVDWHCLSVSEAVAKLEADLSLGLSSADAAARLARHGENRLVEAKPRSLILRFIDQFKGVLVAVLMLAAVLAAIIGDVKDASVILFVIFFNGCMGFYQEYRAEKTLETLKGMLAATARVRRNGRTEDVSATSLVPGELVLLEAGDQVPADGRLVIAHELEVEEAALTGESQAVCKITDAIPGTDRPLGDRTNLLFMNTVLTRGRAELLVTETGMATQMGRLASIIATTQNSATPLEQQLDSLGKRLAMIAGAIVVVIFAMDYFRGLPLAQAAMTAVALAVAAIPEGLPAVVTLTLAIGMWRMGRNKAILKKLSAVETLGSTTVICSDKTGTLTLNQMTARALWCAGKVMPVSGQGYHLKGAINETHGLELNGLLVPMAVCSESRVQHGQLIGNPTEGALIVLAEKGGLNIDDERERRPRIAEIPFDSAHKFMATFHRDGDMIDMFIKGAPDVLLGRARSWRSDGGVCPLDPATIKTIEAANETMAGQAMRVLAMASKRIPADQFDANGDLWAWSDGWTFEGMAGLMDPPRAEAKKAIAECAHAGIQVKMITGDHKATAAAVARELGLSGDVVNGTELDDMDDAELLARVDGIVVFARVSPQHKVRIVQALKTAGHIVAMTGDGVNDAPALKAADIGVAMGMTGTAVAKEAANLVLIDDNFATIVRAVEEGRMIYDNIVKFVRFQLSTNIGAIMTVLTATLMGLPAPFTAIQLLWINIIMDGPPAMTLGIEPARPGLMTDPPRVPGTQILNTRRLMRLAFYGLIMMAGCLWAYQWGVARGGQTLGLTTTFTTFVLFQVFNALNARAEFSTTFNANFLKNGKLWAALVTVIVLQAVAVHWPPAQALFATTSLSPHEWLVVLAVASSLLWLEEARKIFMKAVS